MKELLQIWLEKKKKEQEEAAAQTRGGATRGETERSKERRGEH